MFVAIYSGFTTFIIQLYGSILGSNVIITVFLFVELFRIIFLVIEIKIVF